MEPFFALAQPTRAILNYRTMKNATNRRAGKKAAATRKHRAAGKKAAAKTKRRAAGRNAATRKAIIVVKKRKRSEAAKKLSEEALSEREIEVLGHVAAGNRNRDIAGKLFIAEETVKVHLRHIMDKLGAQGRTQAVTIAVLRGIIHL